MGSVWEKFFANAPAPANDAPRPASAGAKERREGGNPERSPEAADTTSQAVVVAQTFDSIGRRNEALRSQLDALEFAFSNIDAIRSHFHEALKPIDDILGEIEHTKTQHLDAESKLESVLAAFEKLKSEHAEIIVERNALSSRQDEITAQARDSELAAEQAGAELAETRFALADRNLKIDRLERELEDSKRRLQVVSDQLPGLRTEFQAKEKRLQEVEQQRVGLEDRCSLFAQENRSLRGRVEELVGGASKHNRQVNELEARIADAVRRVEELDSALSQEVTAHSKLKSAHFDDAEQHRLTVANAREQVHSLGVRSDAAERLLAEARNELRERNVALRAFEQRTNEMAQAMQVKEQAYAQMETDFGAARAQLAETEAARATLEARASDLARALEVKSAALRRAETRVGALEIQKAEEVKLAISELELRDAAIAKLQEELEEQAAARAFAEGALHSARQDRVSWHRSLDPSAPGSENAREKVTRLRG